MNGLNHSQSNPKVLMSQNTVSYKRAWLVSLLTDPTITIHPGKVPIHPNSEPDAIPLQVVPFTNVGPKKISDRVLAIQLNQ
jgi:hypothetical protein